MAKDEKKFVKLGEKANSFYDPLTKVKLAPGLVVELPKNFRESRKLVRALKAGHIEYTDPVKAPAKSDGKASDKNSGKGEAVEIDIDKVDFTEEGLKGFKKAELVNICIQMEVDRTVEELEALTKKDLIDILLELDDEEEEDDED